MTNIAESSITINDIVYMINAIKCVCKSNPTIMVMEFNTLNKDLESEALAKHDWCCKQGFNCTQMGTLLTVHTSLSHFSANLLCVQLHITRTYYEVVITHPT